MYVHSIFPYSAFIIMFFERFIKTYRSKRGKKWEKKAIKAKKSKKNF